MAVRKVCTPCARSTAGGAPLSSSEALHRGVGEEPRLEGPEEDLGSSKQGTAAGSRVLGPEGAMWAKG